MADTKMNTRDRVLYGGAAALLVLLAVVSIGLQYSSSADRARKAEKTLKDTQDTLDATLGILTDLRSEQVKTNAQAQENEDLIRLLLVQGDPVRTQIIQDSLRRRQQREASSGSSGDNNPSQNPSPNSSTEEAPSPTPSRTARPTPTPSRTPCSVLADPRCALSIIPRVPTLAPVADASPVGNHPWPFRSFLILLNNVGCALVAGLAGATLYYYLRGYPYRRDMRSGLLPNHVVKIALFTLGMVAFIWHSAITRTETISTINFAFMVPFWFFGVWSLSDAMRYEHRRFNTISASQNEKP